MGSLFIFRHAVKEKWRAGDVIINDASQNSWILNLVLNTLTIRTFNVAICHSVLRGVF